MTRKLYLKSMAKAFAFARGDTYDALLQAQNALRPIATEIVESHINLKSGEVSEGAVLNIQVSVKECRAVLAAINHFQHNTGESQCQNTESTARSVSSTPNSFFG